jgi:GDPmannose 4,6-dehydratase
MLQQQQPDDFVIATGLASSLQDFVEQTFLYFDLNWREHTLSSSEFFRPSDMNWSQGNPEKARRVLGWESRSDMPAVVKMLCAAECQSR